jgi:hypothetical protein
MGDLTGPQDQSNNLPSTIKSKQRTMVKRILLLGNDDGLPGVKVDMQKYRKFFKSPWGGEWMDYEIIERLNIKKSTLETELATLKGLRLDYLIVIFSGHGGENRGTYLEINASGESIHENILLSLASRQINVHDCCRSYPEEITKSVVNLLERKAFSAVNTRERYERRIMQAAPQQLRLYACSIGEYSYDTSDGGVYSKHLIASSINRDSEYTTVGVAHANAKVLTTAERSDQHPDAILPRLPQAQELILGIRP